MTGGSVSAAAAAAAGSAAAAAAASGALTWLALSGLVLLPILYASPTSPALLCHCSLSNLFYDSARFKEIPTYDKVNNMRQILHSDSFEFIYTAAEIHYMFPINFVV